jgi:hypothetical protein
MGFEPIVTEYLGAVDVSCGEAVERAVGMNWRLSL